MGGPLMWAYWLLTGLLVLLCVCLGIVAGQRDKARMDLELYRAALIRVDPVEARAIAAITHPLQSQEFQL